MTFEGADANARFWHIRPLTLSAWAGFSNGLSVVGSLLGLVKDFTVANVLIGIAERM